MYGSAKVSMAEVYRGLRIFVPVRSMCTAPVQVFTEEKVEQQRDGKQYATSAVGMQKMQFTRRAE